MGFSSVMSSGGRIAAGLAVVVVGAALSGCPSDSGARKERPAAPVSIAEISRGAITLSRTYSGTLESPQAIVIATKAEGLVERITVDIGDRVTSGQVLVELDDDEQRHTLAQTTAELTVARANLAEAKRAAEIAARDLERVEKLRTRGVSSESQLDAMRATQIAKAANVEVATAQLARASAVREAAQIRLGYTKLAGTWEGGEARVVGERMADEGALVTSNTPLLSIVRLDPIEAVVFVSEKDYAYLKPGQIASLISDAYVGESFEGKVSRIAPVFRTTSRQARVEVSMPNPDGRLKPGMFVRVTVVLATVDDAVTAPVDALTTRNEETGVFVTDDAKTKVAWHPVRTGIQSHGRVQLLDGPTAGFVVTLGQQLIDDGSAIRVPQPIKADAKRAADAAKDR